MDNDWLIFNYDVVRSPFNKIASIETHNHVKSN